MIELVEEGIRKDVAAILDRHLPIQGTSRYRYLERTKAVEALTEYVLRQLRGV